MQAPNLPRSGGTVVATPNERRAEAEPIAESEPAGEPCPRCEAKLIDPAGLGWCARCGYCKSLEEDKARAPVETKPVPQQPSTLGMVEFWQVLSKLPNWVWVLTGGVATMIAFNVPPSRSLPEDCLARAVWSSAEIIVGLFMILAAQIWSLCLLAPDDDKLSFKDAILPGRLWSLTLKRLPETRVQVWLASWGLTCMLSAIIVVGGQSYWLQYLPRSAPPPETTEKTE